VPPEASCHIELVACRAFQHSVVVHELSGLREHPRDIAASFSCSVAYRLDNIAPPAIELTTMGESCAATV
jgi:hypothetical protein